MHGSICLVLTAAPRVRNEGDTERARDIYIQREREAEEHLPPTPVDSMCLKTIKETASDVVSRETICGRRGI